MVPCSVAVPAASRHLRALWPGPAPCPRGGGVGEVVPAPLLPPRPTSSVRGLAQFEPLRGKELGLRPWGGRAVTGGVSEMLVGALGVGALAERRATLLGRGFGSAAEHREGLAGAPMPPGPEAVPGRWENK